jgi:hypothetical protein
LIYFTLSLDFQQVRWTTAPKTEPNLQATMTENVSIALQKSAEQSQCSSKPGGTVGLGMRLEIDCSALPSGAIVREITTGSAAHNSGKIVIGDVLE